MQEGLKLFIEYGILGFLGLLSFISVWLGIERWLHYRDVNISKFDNKFDLEIDLTKNLTLISTIAANSVYIGLLGTVMGIMLTFSSLGETGLVDSKTIMQSLSYTLIATAAGLLVAIPAIVIYNLLARYAETIVAKWESVYGKN
jgi:biopolymer transport protein ExbB